MGGLCMATAKCSLPRHRTWTLEGRGPRARQTWKYNVAFKLSIGVSFLAINYHSKPCMKTLDEAFDRVERFKRDSLRRTINAFESALEGAQKAKASRFISEQKVEADLLGSALLLKKASAQINEVVHSVGILVSIPLILEPQEAHETTTGPEIWAQLESAGLRPDAFVGGVGTGGTVMGVGRYLRARNPDIRVHPVEPAESPTISTGHKVGKHRIQGISDEFIPALVDLTLLDSVIPVSDGDSILMAQKLASSLGLAVGISSGCNFLAALQVQEELGPAAVVATVFADDNKKYLSTDLTHVEPVRPDYLAPEVTLTGISAFGRVCSFC